MSKTCQMEHLREEQSQGLYPETRDSRGAPREHWFYPMLKRAAPGSNPMARFISASRITLGPFMFLIDFLKT